MSASREEDAAQGSSAAVTAAEARASSSPDLEAAIDAAWDRPESQILRITLLRLENLYHKVEGKVGEGDFAAIRLAMTITCNQANLNERGARKMAEDKGVAISVREARELIKGLPKQFPEGLMNLPVYPFPKKPKRIFARNPRAAVTKRKASK